MFHRLILTPNLLSNNKNTCTLYKELTHIEELTTLTNENEENYMPIKFWLNFNNSITLGIFSTHWISFFVFFIFYSWYGVYGPFKNISLILSRSLSNGERNPHLPGENQLHRLLEIVVSISSSISYSNKIMTYDLIWILRPFQEYITYVELITWLSHLCPQRSLESAGYTRANVARAHVKFQLNAKR